MLIYILFFLQRLEVQYSTYKVTHLYPHNDAVKKVSNWLKWLSEFKRSITLQVMLIAWQT